MIKTISQILLFCCCSMGFLRGQTSTYWCDGLDLSLETPRLPIRLTDVTFTSVGDSSFVHLQVGNGMTKAIESYLILVGLFDKDGKYLLTIPFYNVEQKRGETPFVITFARWLYAHQSSGVRTLQPLSTEQLKGDSPTVTFTCPAFGRVMMVQLKYTDGETFSYASPGLSLEPIIAWAPVSDSNLSGWTPVFATAKLSVDADGHARLTGWQDAPQGLFDLVQKQVKAWLLSRPLGDSKAVPAELALLIYLEDVGSQGQVTPLPEEFYSKMPLLRARGLSTLIVVHAYRASPAAKRWIVVAGHQWVERLDERQR